MLILAYSSLGFTALEAEPKQLTFTGSEDLLNVNGISKAIVSEIHIDNI